MVVIDGVEMVDVREAAALAHRTPETIRRWVWSGRLAARKRGNRLLLAYDDVVALAGTGGDSPVPARLSLSQWWEETRRVLGPGRRGVSAADLVLADRAERSGPDAGR